MAERKTGVPIRVICGCDNLVVPWGERVFQFALRKCVLSIIADQACPGYQLWPTIGRLEASAQISRCKPDEGDYFMPIPKNTSIDTIDAGHQISNSFCMNNGDARFRVP